MTDSLDIRLPPEQITVALDQAAKDSAFLNFQRTKAFNTLRRHRADLGLLEQFMDVMQLPHGALYSDPFGWAHVTFGAVSAFKEWMIHEGYAVGSISIRLSTIHVYAQLAYVADGITQDEYLRIRSVAGFRHSEGVNLDQKRAITRIGHKKPIATEITLTQARSLVEELKTAQDYRDRAMITLMIEHGLRVSEMALLRVGSINLRERKLTFYRPKIKKTQTHNLTSDAHTALTLWLQRYRPKNPNLPLFCATLKNGKLFYEGLTESGIEKRIRLLGLRLGIESLSPHDLRHLWARRASGSKLFAFQEAGGWASLAMPRKYVALAKISNHEVKLRGDG